MKLYLAVLIFISLNVGEIEYLSYFIRFCYFFYELTFYWLIYLFIEREFLICLPVILFLVIQILLNVALAAYYSLSMRFKSFFHSIKRHHFRANYKSHILGFCIWGWGRVCLAIYCRRVSQNSRGPTLENHCRLFSSYFRIKWLIFHFILEIACYQPILWTLEPTFLLGEGQSTKSHLLNLKLFSWQFVALSRIYG